jgi:hypothetical protein
MCFFPNNCHLQKLKRPGVKSHPSHPELTLDRHFDKGPLSRQVIGSRRKNTKTGVSGVALTAADGIVMGLSKHMRVGKASYGHRKI